ncbi:MAG: glycoside hydrolase family 3 N-terminal domain-containing protein [Bacteroidota bacterium]
MKSLFLLLGLLSSWWGIFAQTESFRDPAQPLDQRVENLLGLLTAEEKIGLLRYDNQAVPRLEIPAYNWWNEALHGMGRNGRATVFPQAIGLAATFDPDLAHRVATAISDEARAKYNAALQIGNRSRYAALSFWTPNVNLFRDPRWGRGQETYGEDPFLAGTMGSAIVRGLQGDHPTYLKAAACAKHYVVHSGPEADRHVFDAVPPRKDFEETYLPAFRMLVQDANVEAVMCAYNRTYGEPCCGSPYLLQDILRKRWGFSGHIVSDCWALMDIHTTHGTTETGPEAAALALKSGVNVNCGSVYAEHLPSALKEGLISEGDLDEALRPLLTTRFKLGFLDPPGSNPFDAISTEVINSDEHHRLAYEVALRSAVLLKNDGTLPLSPNLKELALVGPFANSTDVLIGNYFGSSPRLTTIHEGVASRIHPGTSLEYQRGQLAYQDNINPIDWTTGNAMAKEAVIAVLGIDGMLEGEEGESLSSPSKGDRTDICLPEPQRKFLKKLRDQGDTPIILVLTGGSPIALDEEILDLVNAVLFVWYPGEAGGEAIADLIFGNASPSGKLPLTFPKNLEQLPPYEDYSMQGRTYRFMEEDPAFPFGFGLSYSSFSYDQLSLSASEITSEGKLIATVEVSNTGEQEAEEVVQVYASYPNSRYDAPQYDLKAYRRIRLKAGEKRVVEFELSGDQFVLYDEEGEVQYEKGVKNIYVGGSVPTEQAQRLGGSAATMAQFQMK